MRFVITGAPRSATRYGARLLHALHIACTHECTLRPFAQLIDVVRWYQKADTGESSWMGWTLLPMLPGPVPVLHTIRNPWSVIDSLANRNGIFKFYQDPGNTMQSVRETIDAYLPEANQYEHRIDRVAAFVLGWNRLIAEAVPDRHVYYAERIDVPGILDFLGVTRSKQEIEAALDSVRTDTNAGYTVTETLGVSDPLVAKWIAQYAEQEGFATVQTRKIKNQPDRETPEELAARMDPDLAEQVDAYAARHGYPTVSVPLQAVA